MVPTLENNDWLIIEKVSRSLSFVQGKAYIPERGQIVVLDSALVGINGQEEQLIKRVIGIPGDTITIQEDGVVIVKNAQNPQGINIDQQLGLNLGPTSIEESGPIVTAVGPDEIFVMGDNRSPRGSFDSRSFGTVKSSDLEGRLWARLLPINESKIY